MIIPVILSGGGGSRLWPLSNADCPKQFLPLLGDQSLLRQTVDRVSGATTYGAPVIVGSEAHRELLRRELTGTRLSHLILEPLARNTAVAITMAAILVAEVDPKAVMLVMPSDHRIGDESAFHEAVQNGLTADLQTTLVTFGIVPTRAESEFGYLHAASPVTGSSHVLEISEFREKPDLDTARGLVETGDWYWNSGMFLFRASTFLDEAARWAPDVTRCARNALAGADCEDPVVRPDADPLKDCPNISVDHAVMEKSDALAMTPLAADWSDVGTWDALADVDDRATGAFAAIDSRNCYVRSENTRIALLGVDDLIVVAQGDLVMIMKRGHSRDIKRLAALAANDY